MAEIQRGQTGKDPSKQGLTLWLWDGGGDGGSFLSLKNSGKTPRQEDRGASVARGLLWEGDI